MMRILMLGNSFTFTNHMPQMLAGLTGAEVVCHTRGGARLSEHLNPSAKLGAQTQAVLRDEHWDYVVLQEMSHGPITTPMRFFSSVEQLCKQIRECGAVPVLYATWAYQKGGGKLTAKGWDYDEMAHKLHDAYHKAAQKNHALVADVGQLFYDCPLPRTSTPATVFTPVSWVPISPLRPSRQSFMHIRRNNYDSRDLQR